MILAMAAAGSVGATLRYLVWARTQRRAGDIHMAIGMVNLIGALLLGLVAGWTNLEGTASQLAVGFLGGFTTFSTWMVDSLRLAERSRRLWGFLNLALTAVAGVGACALGYWIAG